MADQDPNDQKENRTEGGVIIPAEKIEQNVSTSKQVNLTETYSETQTSTMKKASANISNLKQKILQRKQENQEKIAKLKKQLSSFEEEAPLQMLEKAMTEEQNRQERLKEEIDKASQTIRDLREKEKQISKKRAEYQLDISKRSVEIRKQQKIRDSEYSTDEQKQAAIEKIDSLKVERQTYRTLHDEEGVSLREANVNVQSQLKTREKAEGLLSVSKRTSRDLKSDFEDRSSLQDRIKSAEKKDVFLQMDLEAHGERNKQKLLHEAESLTPQQLKRQLTAAQSVNAQREASIATARLGKDASMGEKVQYKQVAQEFNELVNSIKAAKSALAELEEGTEEYAEKQDELNTLNGEAAEKAKKMADIEGKAEDRRQRGGGTFAGRQLDRLERGFSQLANIASAGLNASSQGAIERYTTEEERKSADIRLKAKEVSDYEKSFTDASALLAVGGGKRFGAESPYDLEKGGTSESIKALGDDYIKAVKAMPAAQLALQVGTDLTKTGLSAVQAGANAVGSNALMSPVGAPAAALGTLVTGTMNTGINALNTVVSNPQLSSQLGGGTAARTANRLIGSGFDTLGQAASSAGYIVGRGGGNEEQFRQAAQDAVDVPKNLTQNITKAFIRADEQVKEQNKLTRTQIEDAQVERVKERSSLAFAPKLQMYLDTLPAQREINKSLGFQTRTQREETQKRVEQLSISPDLTEMGFSPQEVIQSTQMAAQAFGRHGRGEKGFDLIQRSVKQSAIAENLGMGDASQSMAAMGAMMKSGVEDPAKMMSDAMQTALMKGLQDSRDFQGLLSAASETADNTVGFEGSLKLIADAAGTGRAGDLETAKSFAEMVDKQTSGATGTYRDIVKMQQTKESAQEILKFAQNEGIDLGDKGRQELLRLQRIDPKNMQNRELMEGSFGPETLQAIKAYEAKRKKAGDKDYDFFKDTAEKMNMRASFSNAIEYTQSEELRDVKNMMVLGDKAGLEKMFGMQTGATQKEKEEGQRRYKSVQADLMGGTMAFAAGDKNAPDQAIGALQYFSNSLAKLLGQDVSTGQPDIIKKHRHGMTAEEAKKAQEEAKLSGSTAEQQKGGIAEISADKMTGAVNAVYNPITGKQDLIDRKALVQGYKANQTDLEDKVRSSKTVTPQNQMSPVDQELEKLVDALGRLKDSFKDFKVSDAAINVAGDIIVEGKKVVGAFIDDAISGAAKEVGNTIVTTIKENLPFGGGSSRSIDKPKPQQPKQPEGITPQ